VRLLAQRSATAAKEIKSLIQDSVRKVEAGSQMVNQSGDVLLEIVSSVKRVTDIVGEIAAASREQATSVEEVAKAISQMDQVTQQNTAQTEELSSTAQMLATGADRLQGLVDRFQLENDRTRRKSSPARTQRRAAPVPRTFSKGLAKLSQGVGPAGMGPAAATEPAAMPGGFTEF
jgi:transcriptional regulator of acetoin/glycerol metabolism